MYLIKCSENISKPRLGQPFSRGVATLVSLAVKVDLEASHRGSVGSQANRSGEAGKREKKVE